jgi:hypothetical protein
MIPGFPLPLFSGQFSVRFLRHCRLLLLIGCAAGCITPAIAQGKTPPAKPMPDVLVLSNGDTLHGQFVSEVDGNVTFHSDVLGNITLGWNKIKELRAGEKFAVLDKNVKLRGKRHLGLIPVGNFDVANNLITVHAVNAPQIAPIPVKNAQYIMNQAVLDKEVYHEPNWLSGWNGAATAGATLVSATQKQYTFSGGFGLVRTVPTVSWLNPRNRTSLDFSGSFGKIIQPSYTIPATTTTPATFVPEAVTKSAIYHADAERDEYISPRLFILAQTAFDHNYGQDLDLQQIYGGGFGWTIFKSPRQEMDLKGTIQYEKQQFISETSASASIHPNLVGSTFSANYILHLKLFTYAQLVAYIPAYNDMHAYSTNETNTFTFPAYKNLGFSLGTMDSYLNGPPASEPPTKRNSFQFTMGLTYAIKSKY